MGNRRDTRAAWTFLLVAGLVVAACQGSSVVTPTAPLATSSPAPSLTTTVPTQTAASTLSSTTVYTIEVRGEPNGNGVSVTGTTNLPEGAVVTLSASRAFRNMGEEDIRAVSADRYDVTVAAGTFAGLLALDESDLLVFVGTGPADDTIDTIDRDVTVCAQFQTGTDLLDGIPRQPESIVAVVGPNGEAVATSPQVYVFGSATANPAYWLEARIDVTLASAELDALTAKQNSAPDEVDLDGFCL